MKRSYRIALSILSAAIASALSACDFFHSPVDDTFLREYNPYLTIISFLETNADTTFILVTQSSPKGKTQYTKQPQTLFDYLGCVHDATVTLTDRTTGKTATAFNNYSPNQSNYSGLYMVKQSELPILQGHEYELRAIYKNVQPAAANSVIPAFSNASFDYKVHANEVVVSISNIDSKDRYFYVYIEKQGQSFEFQTTDARHLSNGNIAVVFRNDNTPSFFGPQQPTATPVVDTCIVFEIDRNAFLYFKKVEAYRDAEAALFSNPIYLFSNIHGGQGILAAKRSVSRKK